MAESDSPIQTKNEERAQLVEKWKAIQRAQAAQAIFRDDNLPFIVPLRSNPTSTISSIEPVVRQCASTDADPRTRWRGLTTIGGLDISYRRTGRAEQGSDSDKSSTDQAIACLAVLSFPELEVLYSITKEVELHDTPYVPSFLGFREAALSELVLDLVADARGRALPQVLLVDGNGRLHPRQAGSAVSVGLATGLPTIGVAKEYFPVAVDMNDKERPLGEVLPCAWLTSQRSMRARTRETLLRRGDWIGLSPIGASLTPPDNIDDYLGAALRSSPAKGGTNPIFVSSGHRVGLHTALELVLSCSARARVPEPVRQADAIGSSAVLLVAGCDRLSEMLTRSHCGGTCQAEPKLSACGPSDGFSRS